ncbi:MAG: carboxy-S-adenosyl-L-methionine synthase CmoA [Pseudohongiellaceae bacterium]
MTTDKKSRDNLFAGDGLPGNFVFDDNVARVFEDMINRSVPGYGTIIAMIAVMAERYCQEDSNVYDLGCSLGAASLAMAHKIPCRNYQIHAVDNSPAMIARLQDKIQDRPKEDGNNYPINCHCADIANLPIENASVVVLNFTLQFIPVARRQALIENIFAGMRPGGVLVLSEKICFPDVEVNELFIDLYHQFKESMGYSQLEISRKRAALEAVLIPEPLNTHRARLAEAGFGAVDVWFQCFNFASMVAFKNRQ